MGDLWIVEMGEGELVELIKKIAKGQAAKIVA